MLQQEPADAEAKSVVRLHWLVNCRILYAHKKFGRKILENWYVFMMLMV